VVDFNFVIIGVILLSLAVGFYLALRSVNRMEKGGLEEVRVNEKPESGVLLSIELPRENERSPLAAEQMYASLHGLLRFTPESLEHISLEMISTAAGIRFYVFSPTNFRNFVEGQIYAQYPDAEIKEVEDYTTKVPEINAVAATDLILTKDYIFPIKTFRDFEEVDPLASITSTLSKIRENEQVWIQILIRPVDDLWQDRGHSYVQSVREGTKKVSFNITGLLSDIASEILQMIPHALETFMSGPKEPEPVRSAAPPVVRLSAGQELELKSIENKLTKMGFETRIRVLATAPDISVARERVSSVAASFKQFSTANLNSFVAAGIDEKALQWVRTFHDRDFPVVRDNYILGIDELASIYHMPNISVETPHIAWTRAKKGEPPLNLPVEGTPDTTLFAETVFRDHVKKFGIRRDDRRKHMYLIGKTGSGKSTLIKNMIIQDIHRGEGLAVLDPHGDLINDLLNYVPEDRLHDVVIFDPADADYPVALNMLEVVDPRQKNLIASGLLDVFKKYFENSWGPRLEYLLMNCILTLLEVPNTSMLGLVRLLTDNDYNAYITSFIQDPVLKDFWNKEFKQMKGNQKLVTEAVSPIQNKVGQFLNASTVRNIVGQPKSTIRIDDIINQGKIFFVNLSTGRIGENNSALLGAMIISQLQFAAMRRVDQPESQRKDFYVYADEFQKFATDSFATILSEARKYRLNLVLTHQYIEQMPLSVIQAVFGNVGSLATYGVGPTDAAFLEKEFAPTFLAQDIINLGRYEMYMKLQIEDMISTPFSSRGLQPMGQPNGLRDEAIRLSRTQYSRRVEVVEDKVRRWAETRFHPGMSAAAQTVASTVGGLVRDPELKDPFVSGAELLPSSQPRSNSGPVVSEHPHGSVPILVPEPSISAPAYQLPAVVSDVIVKPIDHTSEQVYNGVPSQPVVRQQPSTDKEIAQPLVSNSSGVSQLPGVGGRDDLSGEIVFPPSVGQEVSQNESR
jgi:Type IV secretion-system coupling protein DNA-binding domain